MIWKCKDKEIEYGNRTLIMGIVNVTPDSFSDGGRYFSPESALQQALKLEEEGADIIDLGAQSTRPGHTPVSAQQEWERLEGVLTLLNGRLGVPLSADTYYPYVAEKCLNLGVDIINDVSGVVTEEMAKIVKSSRCGWILMHNGPGSVADVHSFFLTALARCEELGIKKEQLCLDMGIGFGKDYEQSLSLLAGVSEYKLEGLPLLLGTSRKRVIGQGSQQENPEQRVYGNIAADTAAILSGVDIIRLHDVKNERQGILMADEIKRAKN